MEDIINVAQKPKRSGTSGPTSTAFRAYDVRGIYPTELDPALAYKVAKAFLKIAPGKKYVIATDMRKSSPLIRDAFIQAVIEENLEIDYLGQTTTDNLYFAVGKFGYDGGVMITASHNSANFNGLKLVKSGAAPVAMPDLIEAFSEIENSLHYLPLNGVEPSRGLDTTEEFITHAMSFGDGKLNRPLKIVVDAGNGMAGKVTQQLLSRHREVELIKMYFEPHADFPHHEANPAVASNLTQLQQKVVSTKADLGVAFDGDGDRVFFVDNTGKAVAGYYIQALLSEYFLNLNKGAAVVYDLRYTRAIESVLRVTGGRGVISKAGHTYIKQKMKQEDAIFGGESTSSHFYYRDNFYADSGLITLEIILKIISATGRDLGELVATYQERFFISGEQNYYLKRPQDFSKVTSRLMTEFPNGTFSDFDGFIIDFSQWRFSLRQAANEPFIRLNIEADSKNLLEEKQAAINNIICEFAESTGGVSNMYGLQTMHLSKKEKLEFLFNNLQYSWNPYKGEYLDELYGVQWTRNQTPLDVLREIDTPLLEKFYEKNKFNIEESIRLLHTYLDNGTAFDELARNDRLLASLHTEPVAYFSLEFGLVDWLQTYSGGLGVLAGDTVKEASDFGLPMVALGLFYAQGYFHQRFTPDGWQLEDYLDQDTDDYPMETVKDEDGLTIYVDVPLGEKIIKVRAWRMKIGRRSLLLLDTNVAENKDMEDRMITYHLYGGDEDTRIKQEIVLAMGGYKILRALGIKPGILHLNEGHSAFTLLAQARELMHTGGIDFKQAVEKSRKNILFTNHTLKQAGNDVFTYQLMEKYLGSFAREVGVDFREIFALGVDPLYGEGRFGMTILGLKNATKVNAVSKIHAVAAQKVWPEHPMIPITNGVHMPTWVAEPINNLLSQYVGEGWADPLGRVNWDGIKNIPDAELWKSHLEGKQVLIKQIAANCGINLPENAMILGWFRRVTAYKQPEILTLDLDRLERIVGNSERPVVFIFGGKAHPQDYAGKEILKSLQQITQQERFKNKLVLIPDYNWRMARYLYAGSDVWINSPIRFQEACGTSGMKAAANGALQFSTIDGWIDEVKDSGIIWEIEDNLNPTQYYDRLEGEILKLYWERENGIPIEWVKRMKETMRVVLPSYTSTRMISDYIEQAYRPILKETLSS